MVKRIAILGGISLLSILIAGAVFSGELRFPYVSLVRALVGLVATTGLLVLILSAKIEAPSALLGKPSSKAPTNREIADAYTYARDTYDQRSLSLLVKMMIELPNFLERINEDVSLEDEIPQLEVITRQIYRIGILKPAAEGSGKINSLLIPLVFIQKGRLLDGFTVLNADGHEIPTLSYNQTRGLLAYAIRIIVTSAPDFGNAPNMVTDTKKVNDVIAKLTEAVCTPGPLDKQGEKTQSRINDLLDSVQNLPISPDWQERIRRFCARLVDYYVIIAETPPPDGAYIQITYRQKIPVESSSLRLANRWRGRFGLRYAIIDIPLHLFALRAEAYHLQMNAAPMQYVYDHRLEWLRSERRVVQDDLRNGNLKPYVHLHHNSAEPGNASLHKETDR